MKKNFFASLVLIIFAASITMSSCTIVSKTFVQVAQPKADTIYVNSSPVSISGLWIGSQQSSVTGTIAALPFNLSIKLNGTLTFESVPPDGVQHFGTGTWVLTDSVLTCNVVTVYGDSLDIGVRQTLTATYNKKTGTLTNGKWMNVNKSNYGTFTVTKVN